MDPELARRLLDALVGRPMVNNAFRGTLVEAMLAGALAPEWVWQADGWGSYDFEGPGGIGLEVKQSAARQDWHEADSPPNRGRFDIAARTGLWMDKDFIKRPGRAAAIYVFAWHPLTDPAIADHRDPGQWRFHVVPASALPPQKTIGLAGVEAMAPAIGIAEVNQAALRLLPR